MNIFGFLSRNIWILVFLVFCVRNMNLWGFLGLWYPFLFQKWNYLLGSFWFFLFVYHAFTIISPCFKYLIRLVSYYFSLFRPITITTWMFLILNLVCATLIMKYETWEKKCKCKNDKFPIFCSKNKIIYADNMCKCCFMSCFSLS